MSLTNIKERASERGFTIVELLIVIVIIGILAGIVILAYAGLTNQAKTSKASTVSADVVKKFEAYNADPANTGYPVTAPTSTTRALATGLTLSTNSGKSWYIPTGSYNLTTTAITSAATGANANGDPLLNIHDCGGGYRFTVWDFSKNQANVTYINGATAAACTTSAIAVSGTL
jgi:prepilin-type N-terminal cleavage/methylation domain-containing protein